MNELRKSIGLNGAHQTFVHSDAVFDDHPEPVSSRYEEAVTAVPELARKRMYEDCTDVYKDVYENGSGERLTQCLNWVALQRQFWLFLYGNNMCASAALGVQMNHCQLWHDRLYLRHYGMEPWRRDSVDDSKILKPELKDLAESENQLVH